MKFSRAEGSHGTTSSDSSSGSRSPAESNRQVEVKTDQGISLNQPLLRNATSSGIPTFLWITGVPVIDRRNKALVSVGTLGQKNNNRLASKGSRYYSTTPLCLRGDIPATSPSSRERAEPKQSVRGPRGAREVPNGAFARPGLLGGLCVSPWVIEEETERAQRALSQQKAFLKDPQIFRRKREEGGLWDYADGMHNVKQLLDNIHPLRDESCPPKSGFSYRRVCHDAEPTDFYDVCLDMVQSRTTGYSPVHIRSMSPSPYLDKRDRENTRAYLKTGIAKGRSLSSAPCLGGSERSGNFRHHCSSGNLMSHATSGRKPQRFNTSQRRREYTCALAAKREAILSRDAAEMVAAELEKERREVASEGREGIDAFEGNLKAILQQKWTFI